ncbi:MAG TPA: hypothetical protein VKU61_11835 [Candidatus Binatia bacterium]|nr:hypothetical protein [Candidatus Binatia bacterium]
MRDIPWQHVIEQANRDGEFRIAARLWNATLRLDVGERSVELAVSDGAIVSAAPCGRTNRCVASVSGAAEEWDELLARVPRPLHQDLFGGITLGRFQLEGDVEAFYAYYPAVRRLVDLVREARS